MVAEGVTRSVEIPAAPAAVWRVLIDGDLLGVCLGGLATIDARPGGEVTFIDGDRARVGAIDQFDDDSRLSFIWYEDERDPSEVVIDLEETDGGTRVRVSEHKFRWEFQDARHVSVDTGSHPTMLLLAS